MHDFTTPSANMFKTLNWMPLKDRVKYRKSCMVYKSLHELAPKYMGDMFNYVSNTHTRDTRSASRNDLAIPGGRHKEVFRQSFAFDGAMIWNSLPSDIRSAESLQSFKSAYLRHYFKT